MGYKGIRFIGFLSALVMLLILGTDLWAAFSGSGDGADLGRRGMWLAFFFLSLLAERIGSILEAQADEVAHLKRLVHEQQHLAS